MTKKEILDTITIIENTRSCISNVEEADIDSLLVTLRHELFAVEVCEFNEFLHQAHPHNKPLSSDEYEKQVAAFHHETVTIMFGRRSIDIYNTPPVYEALCDMLEDYCDTL